MSNHSDWRDKHDGLHKKSLRNCVALQLKHSVHDIITGFPNQSHNGPVHFPVQADDYVHWMF